MLSATGCSGNSAKDNTSSNRDQIALDGHRRMVSLLAKIKERIPNDHIYYGLGVHKELQAELAAMDEDAATFDRFALLTKLGYAELKYEPTPHLAIKHFTEALQLFSEIEFASDQEKTQLSNRVKFYLAVANLRLGETENCCLRHSSDSCILPIRGGGIHIQESGSRQAIKFFQQVLEDNEGVTDEETITTLHQPCIWLMNIAYMTLDEFPDHVPAKYRIPKEFFESEIEFPRFENVVPKLNIDTFNHAGGAIVDDFDNDDYLDIFVSTSDPAGQARYFRNNRDGTFSDQTHQAGLTGLFGGLNMVQADYNNDGNLDVFIMRGAWMGERGRHPNSLLRNNGNGTFTDVTFDAGLGEHHFPIKTAAWADYDNDGDVDLFLANKNYDQVRKSFGRPAEGLLNAPSQLFQNNGDGTFTDVAPNAGVNVRLFAMGAVWGDYDDDRYPDLFVARGGQHYMFKNNQDGTFQNVGGLLGIKRPQAPFPVWFWDYDNDGVLDLYVSNTCGDISTLVSSALAETTTIDEHGKIRQTRTLPTPGAILFPCPQFTVAW